MKTTQVSLYSFQRKCGGPVVQVSFKCVAIAFYHLPDGVAGRLPSGSRAAMENVATSAV